MESAAEPPPASLIASTCQTSKVTLTITPAHTKSLDYAQHVIFNIFFQKMFLTNSFCWLLLQFIETNLILRQYVPRFQCHTKKKSCSFFGQDLELEYLQYTKKNKSVHLPLLFVPHKQHINRNVGRIKKSSVKVAESSYVYCD